MQIYCCVQGGGVVIEDVKCMRMDAKGIIQAFLQYGRTDHSTFLCMTENKTTSYFLPEVPSGCEFRVELEEIDF